MLLVLLHAAIVVVVLCCNLLQLDVGSFDMPDAMLVCMLGLISPLAASYVPQTASAVWHSFAVNY